MSQFGNVPSGSLVDAAEKLVATMNEQDLVAALEESIAVMPSDALVALVEAVLDVFRDRGESSEDAAEASGMSLERIERAEVPAIAGLIRYAGQNIGVLKEAMTLYVEEHPTLVAALPKALIEGISQRLELSP
ncbi:MAG: hypothetical protein ACYDGM_01330 [Vulcanimicrobiaceae bacterium]